MKAASQVVWKRMDTLTTSERSARMALIRSKNTKPEREIRKLLHALGFRFRLHVRNLPGRPDIVFPGRKKVLLVHGCFWHAHKSCKVANLPKSRRSFWKSKFARNTQRDSENLRALASQGWDVLVVWECETRNVLGLTASLAKFLGPAGSPSTQRKR